MSRAGSLRVKVTQSQLSVFLAANEASSVTVTNGNFSRASQFERAQARTSICADGEASMTSAPGNAICGFKNPSGKFRFAKSSAERPRERIGEPATAKIT